MLLFGVLNFINNRFTLYDFQVYYDACGRLLSGESPYGEAFGVSSGYYKYSPAAAWLFAPFHLFGWMGARVVYFLLLTAAIGWGLRKVYDDLVAWSGRADLAPVWWVVVITLAGHFSRELLLGNVNWLLFLGAYCTFVDRKKKPLLAGLFIGLVLAFKPHFVVVLPWLFVRGYYKLLGYALSFFVFLMFSPALIAGWESHMNLLNEWLVAMQSHNTSLAESPNTLYALLGGWMEPRLAIVAILLLVAATTLAFIRYNKAREGEEWRKNANEMVEFFTLVALIPNLVHTDTEHFMWTMPLLVMGAAWLREEKSLWRNAGWVLWVLCMIPYTLATPDLWGSERALWLQESGALGAANVVFIALGIIGFLRQRNAVTSNHVPS
ncbi:MAG: hypothetical protein RL226_791 [Bacteroidota bacterium]|jgi:hypothetical protein